MKRLISFVTAASIAAIAAVSVLAQDTGASGAPELAVLTAYEDGVLIYSTNTEKRDGEYVFHVPSEYEDAELKVFYADEYEVVFTDAEQTEVPAETALPDITSEPETTAAPSETASATEKPTAAPEKTPYPEIYEKALDAVNAPAVVTKVSQQIIDGEDYYVTDMLYQGVEITANIPDTALIASAPARHSELTGENAGALREGDVIHFTCNLQGVVKSIEFIYRPDFENYVHAGGDYGAKFADLIGKDGYSSFYFGVPVKTAKGYVLLADVSGKTTSVDLSTKTFVYTVSNRSRAGKAEITGTGFSAIEKVPVSSSNFDDNDNVISWEDIDDTSYALVRTVRGTATEVIVFVN